MKPFVEIIGVGTGGAMGAIAPPSDQGLTASMIVI